MSAGQPRGEIVVVVGPTDDRTGPAALAVALGRIPRELADRQRSLLEAFGLPVTVPHAARQPADRLLEVMAWLKAFGFDACADVTASAGKKVSIAISDSVTSTGVPNTMVVEMKLSTSSPSRSRNGTATASAAIGAARAGTG